jgi:DNA-binding Lrp family transcriptional regulator
VTTPATTEGTAKNKSVSAYALVSLDKFANLLFVYRKLYFHQNVLYCDATRGDCDLVLLMQASTMEEINQVLETEIKTLRGVSEVSLLEVQSPEFADNVIDIMGSVDKALGRDRGENDVTHDQPAKNGVSSYVMLEVEKDKMEAIYPTLYFDDQVVNCDYAEGRFNVVLLMKGSSFDDIGNTVTNRFRGIDGVLRIKEFPVIALFEV